LLVKKSSKELVKPLGKKTTSVRRYVLGVRMDVGGPCGLLEHPEHREKRTEKTDPRCVA